MRTLSVALLAALALMLAACGGSTTTSPLAYPAVVSSPADATVVLGQTATFSVTALSAKPLTYQWNRAGTAITGATGTSYTTDPTLLADNGAQFTVTISNSSGGVTTAPATLFVNLTANPAQVSTRAGSEGGFADGSGTAAQFFQPRGVALDASGNLYVADTANNRIRMISPSGAVTTLAGSGTAGAADGAVTGAQFNLPQGVAVDSAGANVYVADTGNSAIRVIDTGTAQVTTLAGSGVAGYADGIGAAARFSAAAGITVDATGNVFVADSGNNVIRQITPAGLVTTLAGTAGVIGYVDGTGAAALFHAPAGIVADAAGNLYVADSFNGVIRKIASGAVVTTFAGNGALKLIDGAGATASFGFPTGIAIDAAGNLYTADFIAHAVRRVTPDAVVTTLAGNGATGYADGAGSRSGVARFASPFGVAVGAGGELYVGDSANNRVRKIVQP